MPSAQEQLILVLNSGSSSLKFGVFRRGQKDEELLFEGSADGVGREDGKLVVRAADGETLLSQDHVSESQPEALEKIAFALRTHLSNGPAAVGHRVVHGGPHLREHQLLTPDVLRQLKAAVHFAPLHIPPAIALIEAAQKTFSACPHFACFDDAFHRTMPEVASHLPLPARYFEQGVMRYGFHGISYESIVHRIGEAIPEHAIFAHLGSGSSVVAVRKGCSIDTSMGMTPTGGVPMGTRSGDLDPGVLVYLMRNEGLDADALETMLNHDCGLVALSNGESDMQALLARSDAAAELAVSAFTIGVRKYIGAYAALLGGLDLLVFTGGIGEHSELIRTRICEGLGFLGGETRVMPTGEDAQIARHCRALMSN